MSATTGWESLSAGDLGAAETAFSQALDAERVPALRGLLRIRLLRKQVAEAAEIAKNLVATQADATNVALYAEVLGAQGKRKEAEDWLMRALTMDPKSGWIRMVLGEQRVRRGKWDDGAADMVAGMGGEDRDIAFGHFVGVCVDLSAAVMAGKVSAADATKLINRVDNGTPGKTPEMARFNAAARRAIAGGTIVPESDIPTVRFSGGPNLRQHATRQEHAVSPPPRPRKITEPGLHQHVPVLAHDAPPLARLMAEDRKANEQLQATVGAMGLPNWPSKLSGLDPIPAVRPQLLNYSDDILKRSDMQMTRGSVASSILISRGLDALLGAVAKGAPRHPPLDLLGLAQVEMRCLDQALEDIGDFAHVYNLEDAKIDHTALAIGALLGTIAVKMTPAVWDLERDVMASHVMLGATKMQPFRAAAEWLAASDKDDAYLDYPIRRLLAGAGVSPEPRRQIDMTADLKDAALRLRLAELWMSYFARASSASQVDISDDIHLLAESPYTVVFSIHPRWVPAVGLGPRQSAAMSDGFVPMAYVRTTGEFLLLGTRQHFARFIRHEVPDLTPKSATNCMEFFLRYHRPGAQIVSEGEHSPRMVDGAKEQKVLQFWARRRGATTGYQLIFDARGLLKWRLEFQAA